MIYATLCSCVISTEPVLCLTFVLTQIFQCLLSLTNDGLFDLRVSWRDTDFERVWSPVRTVAIVP